MGKYLITANNFIYTNKFIGRCCLIGTDGEVVYTRQAACQVRSALGVPSLESCQWADLSQVNWLVWCYIMINILPHCHLRRSSVCRCRQLALTRGLWTCQSWRSWVVNEIRPGCFGFFIFFSCEVLPKVSTSIKSTCKSRFYRFSVKRSNIKYQFTRQFCQCSKFHVQTSFQ